MPIDFPDIDVLTMRSEDKHAAEGNDWTNADIRISEPVEEIMLWQRLSFPCLNPLRPFFWLAYFPETEVVKDAYV
jgi:hypothetical protein